MDHSGIPGDSLPLFYLDIQTPDRKQVALLKVTDHAQQLSFSNILGAIQYFLRDPSGGPDGGNSTPGGAAGGTVKAFQYMDEDGDLITVRSQDETATMLRGYVTTNYDMNKNGFRSNLVIFPHVARAKSSLQRNIHGLTVSTHAGPTNSPAHAPPAVAPVGSGPMSSSPASVSSTSSPRKSAGMSAASDGVGSAAGGQNLSAGGRQISSGGMMVDDSGKQDPGDITQMLGGQLCIEQLAYDPERDRLGSGNGGVVFRARHRQSGTEMALKRIRLDISEEKQKQIINELSILHRCHSPFIISFYGSFFHDNEIHIGTELMDGGSLDQYGPIHEPVLGYAAVMVVRGLQYLWHQKIMHRDVKPSNMLVNSQGVVKLCDFGVSVQLVRSVTQTFCGTNAYMSPERLVGTAYRIESDLWSLGVSLYEMAMESLPFRFDPGRPLELINHIASGRAAQLPGGGQFSDCLVLFVRQCLEREPGDRPAREALDSHPFVRQYSEPCATSVVGSWVQPKAQGAQFRRQKRL